MSQTIDQINSLLFTVIREERKKGVENDTNWFDKEGMYSKTHCRIRQDLFWPNSVIAGITFSESLPKPTTGRSYEN